MISYLGISLDDLLQTFEDAFVFSDDRASRFLEEAIEVAESEELEAEEEELEASADDELSEDEEDFEDDGIDEVFIDDEGRLHAIGHNVYAAAEAAIDLLTDYIVADDLDDEWLTLDQARGVLLALRVILPTLEEIPELESAYSFSIERDPSTGYPKFLTMKPLEEGATASDTLTFTAESYEGQISGSGSLVEIIEAAGVPEKERELLFDVISEGIFTLDDQQCGIVLDVKAFTTKVSELAQGAKGSVAEDDSVSETQH